MPFGPSSVFPLPCQAVAGEAGYLAGLSSGKLILFLPLRLNPSVARGAGDRGDNLSSPARATRTKYTLIACAEAFIYFR